MQTITEYLSAEHRHCDDLFAEAEAAAANNDLAAAQAGFTAFYQETERHFLKEENIMFPAVEELTGGSCMSGPTSVMRMEHGQMRGLFEDIQAALEAKNTSACAGMLETLLIVMQQHNMKEEQMLYRMADNKLENREDIVLKMQALP